MRKQRLSVLALTLALTLVLPSFSHLTVSAEEKTKVKATSAASVSDNDPSVSDNNPSNPDDNNPSNPDDNNPSNPDDNDPSVSDNNPSNPDDNNPSNPDDNNPSNPDDNNPSNPDDNNPSNPDDNNPSNPDVVDPSDILSDAMESGASAEEITETLKNNVDISVIKDTMQEDAGFLGQVKELEAKYIEEKGITTGTDVSAEAQNFVDAGKVTVVGAAFNAIGSSVNLNVEVTPEDKKVPVDAARYGKSIQLEIKLISDNSAVHVLTMPITITMPVPKGIDAARLAVLHYRQNGTATEEKSIVNDDGTVTFTVTEFSTFAFAEKADVNSGDSDTDDDNDDNDDSDSSSVGHSWDYLGTIEDRIQSAESKGVVVITKEQGVNTLSNSVMQMLVKRSDVTLIMEYTYEGKDYRVVIPAGKAVNDEIPWYGPLYLAGRYGSSATVSLAGDYIVKKGDTLGRIARDAGLSLAQVVAMNPQIKDVNFIKVGQKITLK